MKKLFCFILFLFSAFWGLTASAITIKGGVTYTVESAREEAFKNIDYSIPQHLFSENKIDPNSVKNQIAAKQQKTKTKDRYVTWFSDGAYSVVYKKNLLYEYEYSQNGELTTIGKRSGLKCPVKTYKYNLENKLYNVILHVCTKESYVFDENGTLIAHWIDSKCYDNNGNLILNRY